MTEVHHPASRENPFSDDKAYSQPPKSKPRPPPPPPKQQAKKVPATTPDNHHDISEAVRETVTVQGQTERNKMARSNTNQPAATARPPPGRRAQSQDSANALSPADKSKSSKHRPKKGSQHADVIDRLDFTGVGPMFHHDGPFDACAPSRNKHRTKAPMAAWSPRDPSIPGSGFANDSPYPTPAAAATFSYEYEQPKKKVDAIAEAWGIHEPEPFEEFAAGGGGAKGDTPTSSIYNGRSGRRDRVEEPSSTSKPRANRRTMMPPPKPIFVPDAGEELEEVAPSSPPAGSPGAGPKRSKSLMQRIRKMRDAPNVPVVPLPEEISPTASLDGYRPSHRQQNSKAYINGDSRQVESTSPASERSDAFVFVDDTKRRTNDKDLPVTPGTANTDGSGGLDYFDGVPSSPGVGRRASIMSKVRGVVRGGK